VGCHCRLGFDIVYLRAKFEVVPEILLEASKLKVGHVTPTTFL